MEKNEAGQRLDKLLRKYLKAANSGFIYKMLRKKNIVLNDRKASGEEILMQGDSVKMYFSEDTFAVMTAGNAESRKEKDGRKLPKLRDYIIYEDADILLVNKPAGWLSQGDGSEAVSVNELCIAYLAESGQLTEEQLKTFKPGIANRLDRNTSGIILFGKSLPALQCLAGMLRDRSLKKYYCAVTEGSINEKNEIHAFLKKDEKTNRVTVKETEFEGAGRIDTAYVPKYCGKLPDGTAYTVLRVHLITGKTHQIRAHLASTGHPVVGDSKYGEKKLNLYVRKLYGIHSQLLHAEEIVFPDLSGTVLAALSERTFRAPLPETFYPFVKSN